MLRIIIINFFLFPQENWFFIRKVLITLKCKLQTIQITLVDQILTIYYMEILMESLATLGKLPQAFEVLIYLLIY